ncbi:MULTISPECIES: ATP-binding protein [unclassified Fusibacter]|uniref:sensor histidine kinase n=1 Tax=unclassified Fusibacter TaxID=2624464 RepID=UPI0013E958F8|nr:MULTISPECIES: ATP-binding protein [unclassified Fusibacter]MCK8059415.1 HAMP domain-containing histidine kinase [Fusibacter sp. A2]NPE21121.1 HAMP domain-containing histidine kinase [Fusibacter sp. A1]
MPRKSSIKRKLTLTFVVIIFVTVLIFELIFTFGINSYYYQNIEQILKDRMQITVEVYDTFLGYESLGSKAKFILENASVPEYVDAQILDKQGNIIESTARFNSDHQVSTKEFLSAKSGSTSVWRGRSPETDELIMAVSTPLSESGNIIGVLRYMTSIEEVDKTVKVYLLYAYLIGVGVLVVVLNLSTIMAKRIVEPIYELKAVADNIALGNFNIKAQKYAEDELGELADTINYMAEEIMKTEKLKHDFISSISHELRTPLTSIKGWSETILTGSIENVEETKLGLEIISKETERLHGLVENLLDFSKLEAERIVLSKIPLNLVELIERVFKQFSTVIKTSGLTYHVSSAEKEVIINGDRNRLKQVLINIVDNAIKHTPTGGAVVCQISLMEDKVILTIRDNGSGIAKEHLDRIVDRFYKANPNQGGSGLGLAITKRIVELHDGVLKIESELGKGTAVSVILPMK